MLHDEKAETVAHRYLYGTISIVICEVWHLDQCT